MVAALNEEIASDPYVAIDWGEDEGPTTLDAEKTTVGRQPIECRADARCNTTRCPWCGPWLTEQVTPLPAPLPRAPEAPRARQTLVMTRADFAPPRARRSLLPYVMGGLVVAWVLLITFALARAGAR